MSDARQDRFFASTDQHIRVRLPEWLDHHLPDSGLGDTLRQLPPITDMASLEQAEQRLEFVLVAAGAVAPGVPS